MRDLIRVKALTVHQPWAWAIAHGHKPVENRTQRTSHRGLTAVHAGLRVSGGMPPAMTFVREHLADQGVPFHWDNRTDRTQQLGLVVGLVDIVGVCEGTDPCDCGPWAISGQKHWQLAHARPLADPIPACGRQGMWSIDLPADLPELAGVGAR